MASQSVYFVLAYCNLVCWNRFINHMTWSVTTFPTVALNCTSYNICFDTCEFCVDMTDDILISSFICNCISLFLLIGPHFFCNNLNSG
jgi:hypothetical protein